MQNIKITQSITLRDSLALEKYLIEIKKYSVLSADEECHLFQRIRSGDTRAADIIVKANLKFVVSVAKKFLNLGMPLNDLINEGNIGLIKAVNRFDETKGFKFISYAVWWIRQSIFLALSEDSKLVRIPIRHNQIVHKIERAITLFNQKFERDPSKEELADFTNLTLKEVKEYYNNKNHFVSLDEPVNSSDRFDESFALLDLLEADNQYAPDFNIRRENDKSNIDRLFINLNEKESKIVKAYFGLEGTMPMKLEDIGEMCNLTRERVRQIKEKALLVLKSSKLKTELLAS
jgi:RNA polymerase primary sigma factor